MINVIGVRRLIVLAVLLIVNGTLAAAMYLYVNSELDRSGRDLKKLRQQVSTVQSDIDRMQIEFEQLGKQQNQFDALKEGGFFSVQTRSIAKEKFKKIQQDARVISAVANVKSGHLEDNAEAAKAKHKMLVSPIEIEIKAFDDGDIYKYLHLVETEFPGHVSVETINIRRISDVNAPVLRAIATGANPELVQANVVMMWRTIIPEDQALGGGK